MLNSAQPPDRCGFADDGSATLPVQNPRPPVGGLVAISISKALNDGSKWFEVPTEADSFPSLGAEQEGWLARPLVIESRDSVSDRV
jgi:hypothetical protein